MYIDGYFGQIIAGLKAKSDIITVIENKASSDNAANDYRPHPSTNYLPKFHIDKRG